MAPQLVAFDRPSELDHLMAELQGIYLCEECGKELSYPKDPQMCGRCELRLADELEENA